MSKWLAPAVVSALASACYSSSGAFVCSAEKPCGTDGVCEPGVNLCSFPDPACGPGGRSFGGLSGDQAGKCVGGEPPIDASMEPMIDAPPDAPPDALVCYGTGIVRVCFASAPTAPLMVSDLTPINTTNSPMCAAFVIGGDYCVLVGTTITIQGTLRATGTKPLVLVASDTITTSAPIDVASHRLPTEEIGAGADSAACDAGTAPATATGTSGGGAGGSFIGFGGDGGNGADPQTGPGNGGSGGGHGAGAGTVTVLRGGCPGRTGAGTAPGAGGHGGGAVFLIAGNKIEIHGGITAGGEGGSAATSGSSGGGGGGTGGMIGFDAPIVAADSLILANGGGGGEASGQTTAGATGADSTAVNAASGGKNNTSFGGDGGDGSTTAGAGAGAKGMNGSKGNPGGGGGGGGGSGLIKAANANLGNMVSPLATP